MEKLTIKKLKEMKPGIFAKGETSVEDYWDASKEMQVRWVATRGGIHDWAIYYNLISEDKTDEMIKNLGNKMHNEESIKKCVPCDDEAFGMYRH